ncbi:leucine-rich repeat-containing DDB_G0290503 isoform X1 [Paramuricea clavata]|uniref:Leucine-rich repeat-containing DDB_G0290503 isoform X1 n=1 Tax=Paramuricea clavata TaxID=317549 RepID=A0A6S7IC88_PARCT|nr:leucine-rich repeat-containing DDB_G0290503 isoform X1 [Paramuricea clavata]
MNDKCIDFHLGGDRSDISLNNILQFATCDEEVPLLGYENGVKPSTTFHEVAENKSFIPTANTCLLQITATNTISLEIALPDEETLFQLYDMAFLNAYFGRK